VFRKEQKLEAIWDQISNVRECNTIVHSIQDVYNMNVLFGRNGFRTL